MIIIRYKLETKVVDISGETIFTIFNEEVEKIVGKVATVVKELEEATKACVTIKYENLIILLNYLYAS